MQIFCDIETTSLDEWRGDPITMAFVVCDDDLDIKEEILVKSRPMHKRELWNERAAEVHGIDIDEAYRYPTSDITSKQIFSKIMSYDKYNRFICHAQPTKGPESCFDYKYLFAWFWKNDMREEFYKMFGPVEATISMARKITLEKYDIPNQKLGTWAKKLGLEFKNHEALDDAKMCREVYIYQKNFKQAAL